MHKVGEAEYDIGGSKIKFKDIRYTFDGNSFSLADLYSYARAELNLVTSGSKDVTLTSNLDNTMKYMAKITGLDFTNLDAFSEKTLGKIGYGSAIRHVKTETGGLIDVPQVFNESAEIFMARSDAFQMAFNESRPLPSRQVPTIKFPGDSNVKAQVAIDADFLNDFIMIGAAKEGTEESEKIIVSSYMQRLRRSGTNLTDDKLKLAAEEYINMLRRMKMLRIAQQDKRALKMPQMDIVTDDTLGPTEQLTAQSPTAPKSDLEKIDDAVTSHVDEQRAAQSRTDQVLEDIQRQIEELSEQRSRLVSAQDDMVRQSSKYRRVGQVFKSFLNDNPQINNLFKGAMQNKGKILAGAATATGLAVFAMKKNNDVTEQGVAGPPLLPGGSPYEKLPSAAVGLPDPRIAAGGQGTSYNVSFNASQEEIDEFMTRAGSLSNGQIQGTMHDTLPNLGGNSYDDIAGSF